MNCRMILLLLFMFGVYNSVCATCVTVETRNLANHTDRVSAIAWSPDGTMIASGDYDNYMFVWDVVTGEVLHRVLGQGNILGVSWFPDSKSVIAVGDTNTAKIFEITTGAVRIMQTETNEDDDWYDVGVSPDGSEIAFGGHDEILFVFNVADILTGSATQLANLGLGDDIGDIKYSPDGSKIATAHGKLLSIHTRTATDPVVWQTTSYANNAQHTSDINSIDWSPDGSSIVTGSGDYNVKIWDIATGTARTFIGHTAQVHAVRFSPDGSTVASGSRDNSIRVWDVSTGFSYVVGTASNTVYAVDWSPDCCSIVSGDDDYVVVIWSVLDGCRTRTATATAAGTATATGIATPTVTAQSTATATSSLTPNAVCATNASMVANNQTMLPLCKRDANSVPTGGVQVGSVISMDNMRAVLQELYGLPTELERTVISSLSSHQRAVMGQVISEIHTAVYDQQDQAVGMLDNRSPGSTFDMPFPATEAGQATAIRLSQLGTADFAVVTAHMPDQTSLASLGADSINETGLHTFLFSADRFDSVGARVTEEPIVFAITAPTAALNVYSLRSNETTWVNILTEGGRIVDLQDGTVLITVSHTSTFTGFVQSEEADDSNWWLVLAIALPIVALVLVVATTCWFVSSKKKDADAVAATKAAVDYKLGPYLHAYQQEESHYYMPRGPRWGPPGSPGLP